MVCSSYLYKCWFQGWSFYELFYSYFRIYFSINSIASFIWQRAMQYLTSELYRARSIDSRFFSKYHWTRQPVLWSSFFYFYTVEQFNVYFPMTKDQYPLIRPRVNLRKNHVTHVFNISKLQKLQNTFERSFVQYVNKSIKLFYLFYSLKKPCIWKYVKFLVRSCPLKYKIHLRRGLW